VPLLRLRVSTVSAGSCFTSAASCTSSCCCCCCCCCCLLCCCCFCSSLAALAAAGSHLCPGPDGGSTLKLARCDRASVSVSVSLLNTLTWLGPLLSVGLAGSTLAMHAAARLCGPPPCHCCAWKPCHVPLPAWLWPLLLHVCGASWQLRQQQQVLCVFAGSLGDGAGLPTAGGSGLRFLVALPASASSCTFFCLPALLLVCCWCAAEPCLLQCLPRPRPRPPPPPPPPGPGPGWHWSQPGRGRQMSIEAHCSKGPDAKPPVQTCPDMHDLIIAHDAQVDLGILHRCMPTMWLHMFSNRDACAQAQQQQKQHQHEA